MSPDPPNPPSTPDPGAAGPPSSGESLLIAGALRQARRASDTPDPPERLPPPNTFPGYELIREIHRGGQGVVYLALQKATKRKVAVKVLHQGPFAGDKDRQRFEREVEILAQLNHPNIVAVLDSGIAGIAGGDGAVAGAQGSFFCVMEYISGSSLDAWVKEKHPGIDQVLSVFIQICDAVNAAHLKGIIHRDLKPANIRVDHDGKPHVLDFGLARVGIGSTTGGDTPELMTMTGQFIGSLPWASPEQAEGAPDKLDVRTDVYSLGVMLYQMLTDKFPYPVIGMMRDVLDNILRAEPARPSTVRRQINNEVETIVLKCLSKERDRRYQNAGDLGRDLSRYLSGEPIEAKRDSALYLITKTARRHKAAVAVIAGFLVLIIGFGIGMAALYREADGQRREAVAARDAATAASEASRVERERSEAVRTFLEDLLLAADPTQSRGADVRVVDALAAAADRADRDLADQPEIQAAVKQVIGAAYLGLGLAGEAEGFLRSAFDGLVRLEGAESPATLTTMALLAESIGRQNNRFDTARELYTSLIPALQRTLDADDPRIPRVMLSYAMLLQQQQRPDEARQQAEAALALMRTSGAADADLGRAMVKLADILRGDGSPERIAAAAPIAEEGARLLEASLGASHPHTGTMKVQVACIRGFQGRREEAQALFTEGLAILDSALPPTHPDRLAAMLVYADFLHRADRLDDAERVLREVVRLETEAGGPEHVRTAWARAMLGSTLNRARKWQEAETELVFALGVYRRERRDTNLDTRRIAQKLAQVFRESGHPERVAEIPPALLR